VGSRRRTTLVLAALLATACGGAATVDEAEPRVAEGASRLRLEEVATIGCETCPPLEQVSVYSMGMDADGLIWAVDRYAPHMRVFRTSGELVAAFGPKGEGPGDFRGGPMQTMITGHAVLAEGGGRVLVHQMFPPALVEFDLEGNAVRHLPILIPDALTQPFYVLARDPTGPRAFALAERIGAAADDEPFVIHRLEIGDENVRRIEIAAGSEIFPVADSEAVLGTRVSMAVAPDGTLVVGDARAYRFVRLDAEGNVIGRFSHIAERPLKSDVRLDAERRSARRNDQPEEDIDVYDIYFWRRALEFDDAGRLWVALNRPTREKTEFDIFAPDGTFLQRLEIPYHVQRYNIRGVDPSFVLTGGYLAAPVVGPDDEDRIQVWRVIDE